GVYARSLQGLAADPKAELYVLGAVVDGLKLLERLTPEGHMDGFRAFARKVLAPHAKVLKRTTLSADPLERRREVLLLSAFAEIAQSDVVTERALTETERVLDALDADPTAPLPIDADLVGLYLHAAAAAGPTKSRAALWQRMRDAIAKAQDPVQRVMLIRALGGFSEPELMPRSLDLLLDGTLRTQDFPTLTRGIAYRPGAAEASWEWLVAHYDAFVSRLGDKIAPYVPYMGMGFCDAAGRDKVVAFFAARADKAPPGLARNLAVVLESIDQCARLKDANAGPMARVLSTK
ncbi:MAG: ERAP1-like C-terminal domain-containing protein, partial [Myxococcales bacterium]|nr:ERAP1-like C-terminal domain-containing protein [Myxococcales bacterium]